MSDEKRMAGDYEITHSIHIGDNELVMGENLNSQTGDFYMVADCIQNDIFIRYENCYVSKDFTELAEIFAQRLTEQIQKLKSEHEKITVPKNFITMDMCTPVKYEDSILNKVIVIKPQVLRSEHRISVNQLYLATGGNGSYGNARGSAVFCTNLYTQKNTRFERHNVMGTVEPEKLPEWAKDNLAEIIEKYCEDGKWKMQSLNDCSITEFKNRAEAEEYVRKGDFVYMGVGGAHAKHKKRGYDDLER